MRVQSARVGHKSDAKSTRRPAGTVFFSTALDPNLTPTGRDLDVECHRGKSPRRDNAPSKLFACEADTGFPERSKVEAAAGQFPGERVVLSPGCSRRSRECGSENGPS